MNLKIERMSECDALKILFWQYTPPYDWYNLEGNKECLDSFLYESYYVAKDDEQRLVGFYCYGTSAQVYVGKRFGFYEDLDYLDIGLGLNPLCCGKGRGVPFLQLGMKYGEKYLGARKFRLTVADFNERAVKVYKKVGFQEIGAFEAKNNKEKIRFLVMCYEK